MQSSFKQAEARLAEAEAVAQRQARAHRRAPPPAGQAGAQRGAQLSLPAARLAQVVQQRA